MTDTAIVAAWYGHKDAIYRFAWCMTGSASIAEDVLQEVFLALIRAPDRFDVRRAPLRAFLLAVARNQVRKRWEKERRWDTVDDYTFEAAPTIDCGHPVAPGGGVFNLYVYPDPVWQPSTGADTYQLGASSARGMIRK